MKRDTSIKKPNKLQVFLLVCIASLLATALITASTSHAIYTNSLSAQRTVAAYDEVVEDRFSSNYMNQTMPLHTTHVASSTVTPSCSVTVCNYPQGKQNKPNDTDITYTVTAAFVMPDGSAIEDSRCTGYSATLTDGVTTITLDGSHLTPATTITGTLTGGSISSALLTLEFSQNYVNREDDFCVKITATANGHAALSGLFDADVRVQADNDWSGRFNDDRTGGKTPAQYDGFNYLVSGMGSGTCVLTWDTSKVALSEVSRAALPTPTATTSNSITFTVDSDEESRYDLQFYKVNITTETWNDMDSDVVTLEFN